MTFSFPISSRFASAPSSPVRDILSVLKRGGVITFAGGIPDPDLFEIDDLRAAYEHVFATMPGRALQYSVTEGEPELREQAATRLSRQLPTMASDIAVTTGSQEAVFLIGQVLLDPGDVVLVERPTYLAALQAFDLAGGRMVGVECDAEGMVPDALAAAVAKHRPAFVYLVPNFGNPSGRTTSAARREAVAEVLLRTGTPLVEDDPYGELRYSGAALAPIAAVPGMAAQTILLNSASKVMAPGVRIGWLRAEGDVRRALDVAKQAAGLHSPVTDQLAIARYLDRCNLDAHIAKVVAVYRERRDAMAADLAAVLPPGASMTRPEGGMFFWVDLDDDTDTGALLPRAIDEGVAYVPGWAFYADDPRRCTLRLSFVTSPPEVIREGLGRLARAFGWG